MRKNTIIMLALMGVVGIAGQVRAVESKAKTQAEAIGAFIDADTFAVGRVDMTKVDIDAFVAKAIEVFSAFVDDEETMKMIVGVLESFRVQAK